MAVGVVGSIKWKGGGVGSEGAESQFKNPNTNLLSSSNSLCFHTLPRPRSLVYGCHASSQPPQQQQQQQQEVNNLGVKVALSMLKFYKREISPILPKSCRYVPSCSEYSMQAYKKYGVVKGTVLTACRLCRCNPLGGSGYDPPRWFDETSLPEE